MNTASWVVDMGYVVKASTGKFKPDYVRAQRFLEEPLGSTRVFLFNGYDAQYGIPPGLQAFYDSMKAQGMHVQLHPMEPGPPGANRQRRVDVDLSAHLVWQATIREVRTLVLTTGDQDLVPAVELARREFKKKVILFTYDAVGHHDLAAAADEWWRFEDKQARLVRP